MNKPAAVMLLLVASLWSQEARTVFLIKYVADGAVYLDGGKLAGLAEKMKLMAGSAEIEVVSVAAASAVCEIRTPGAELHPGDVARLSAEDAQRSQLLRAAGSGNHYAQTITFTDGDSFHQCSHIGFGSCGVSSAGNDDRSGHQPGISIANACAGR